MEQVYRLVTISIQVPWQSYTSGLLLSSSSKDFFDILVYINSFQFWDFPMACCWSANQDQPYCIKYLNTQTHTLCKMDSLRYLSGFTLLLNSSKELRVPNSIFSQGMDSNSSADPTQAWQSAISSHQAMQETFWEWWDLKTGTLNDKKSCFNIATWQDFAS